MIGSRRKVGTCAFMGSCGPSSRPVMWLRRAGLTGLRWSAGTMGGWSRSRTTIVCASLVPPRLRLRWRTISGVAGRRRDCSSSSPAIAAERGIRRFYAEVLADNARGARRLSRGPGSRFGAKAAGARSWCARHHTDGECVGADRRARPRGRGRVDAIGARAEFDRDRGRERTPLRIPARRSCQT